MEDAIESFKRTLRMAITPNRLFESLNIPYFGPVDGHDIASLIQIFTAMSHLPRPAVLHVYTKKGKGFTIIEINGAGAEAIQAWDPDVSLSNLYREFFKAQSLLFKVAALNRKRGYKPMSFWAFL